MLTLLHNHHSQYVLSMYCFHKWKPTILLNKVGSLQFFLNNVMQCIVLVCCQHLHSTGILSTYAWYWYVVNICIVLVCCQHLHSTDMLSASVITFHFIHPCVSSRVLSTHFVIFASLTSIVYWSINRLLSYYIMQNWYLRITHPPLDPNVCPCCITTCTFDLRCDRESNVYHDGIYYVMPNQLFKSGRY